MNRAGAPGGLAKGEAADSLDLCRDGDRKFVAALARGLEVLRAFQPATGS